MAYNVTNMSDLFQMLESNNQEVVREIKQVIYEQYEEGKCLVFSPKLIWPTDMRSTYFWTCLLYTSDAADE